MLGRQKGGGRGGALAPLGFWNFQQENLVFVVSSRKNQISPLFPTLEKFRKIPKFPPWKKSFRHPHPCHNPSDTHTHATMHCWASSIARAFTARYVVIPVLYRYVVESSFRKLRLQTFPLLLHYSIFPFLLRTWMLLRCLFKTGVMRNFWRAKFLTSRHVRMHRGIFCT